MITPENISRRQAKKLVKLIEQWTRADVMSRMGRFDNLEFADYAQIKLEKEDKIRELLFDESEIAVLAERWGMIKKRDRKRISEKKKKKRRK